MTFRLLFNARFSIFHDISSFEPDIIFAIFHRNTYKMQTFWLRDAEFLNLLKRVRIQQNPGKNFQIP